MEDDTLPPAEDAVTAGWDVLEEQRARIAALRVAVLTGRVPEEGEFDYERFFAVKPEPSGPTQTDGTSVWTSRPTGMGAVHRLAPNRR